MKDYIETIEVTGVGIISASTIDSYIKDFFESKKKHQEMGLLEIVSVSSFFQDAGSSSSTMNCVTIMIHFRIKDARPLARPPGS